MAAQPAFVGELKKDIGMLKGEIRRISAIFNNEKKRGLNIESQALEAEKALKAAQNSRLISGTLKLNSFRNGISIRIKEIEQ